MKQIYLTASLILMGIFHIAAQESQKLTGTIIGTTQTVDYSTFECSYTVNTAANAFDGDLQTIFATCERSNTWAGLDLGEKHVITKIAYCPRASQPDRLLLGVFEGANNPDFGDAIPFYIVSEIPKENVLTSQTVNCSRGFRYVRYIGPNDKRCNIAELEFHGYKSDGDESKLPQITKLPTISIHTVDGQDIVEKEKYIKGIVSIISENGTEFFTDSLEIRGRGNASWGFPKKPYRMKLFNKTNLLGCPAKEKSWTLINNYGDKTLMRNLLAFDLSRRFEMPYTSVGIPVDVFLNGEYKGTYQLCDQIEVASGRVEVTKMKETDIAMPNLSGGYFLEMDAYAYSEISWFTSAKNGIPVTIKYPKDDEIVSAQSNYIKSHFDLMEQTIFNNPTEAFQKYLDLPTFIRHFLIGEISGNTDTYWSTFLYKDRNSDMFFVGPVWDFDLAYENDSRTYPINNIPDWLFATDNKSSAANGVRELVKRIAQEPAFKSLLKSTYAHYRNNGTISVDALLEVVDYYVELMDESQKLNFTRWNIMNNLVHQNPTIWGSYAAEVENVRRYIRERIAWVDKKLEYVYTHTDDIKSSDQLSEIFIYSHNGTLEIHGITGKTQVQVLDLTGRTLVTKTINENFSTSLKKGIYIVRVAVEQKGVKTEKVPVM